MNKNAPSLSERLADDIVEIIRQESLAPGDLMASSRELAQRFDVTTPTVREALRRLEATGVVEFRHGSGTYVGTGFSRTLLVNPHLPRESGDSVLELAEARLVLEPPIVATAARVRDDEWLAQIERSTVNALHPPRFDDEAPVHFHVALAAATGNTLLRETVEALLFVRSREQVEIRHRYHDRERDHAEHMEIYTAVKDRDAEAAERLTREHLTSIRDAVADASREAADR